MRRSRKLMTAAVAAGVLLLTALPVLGANELVSAGPGGNSLHSAASGVYAYPGVYGTGPSFKQLVSTYLANTATSDDMEGFEDPQGDQTVQGWRYNPNGWWYGLQGGGWLRNGWSCIDGRWYYFGQNGLVRTGWLDDGGNRFYLNPVDDGTYGAMRTGWQIIDGKAYYFNASSEGVLGALLTNTTTPDGYRVGVDGAMTVK